MLANLRDGDHSICISSACSKEGRSLVTNGLGLSLAASGFRTLIIDANLSEPSTGYSHPGLADFLARNADLSDVLTETEIPRLFEIVAGNITSSSIDLLLSARTKGLIDSLGRMFDIVLLDSPSLSDNHETFFLVEATNAWPLRN